jgi:hypothetical protein
VRVGPSTWVLGAAVAAGAAGVGLAAAGVDSPLRSVLVLLFLAVAPTVAIAGLLRTMDGFARVIIACAADVVLLGLVSMIMLAEGVWSPVHGLLAVAVITALCLVAQLPPVRRRAAALASPARPPANAARANAPRANAPRADPARADAARATSPNPADPRP